MICFHLISREGVGKRDINHRQMGVKERKMRSKDGRKEREREGRRERGREGQTDTQTDRGRDRDRGRGREKTSQPDPVSTDLFLSKNFRLLSSGSSESLEPFLGRLLKHRGQHLWKTW